MDSQQRGIQEDATYKVDSISSCNIYKEGSEDTANTNIYI